MNWIVGAVLILILSLIFDLGLLAYAMYALLGILLASRYLTRTWADNLIAQRECNRLTADVGDTVAVVVNIENQGSLPIPWCLVEDLLPHRALIHDPPNLKVKGRRVQLSMLPGGGQRQLLYRMQCNRRGYYQLGPLVLETGDLFGLHRRYRVATKPHFLMVYPQVMPLEGYDVSSKRPIGEVTMTHRLYEDPTRIAGVRRYEAGDPLNRVHWKATARTGELHSKVFEPSTIAGATILMDFHRDSHAAKHEPMRSELAITAAASIANAVYEMAQQIGLVTNARDAADRIRQEGWAADIRTRDAARTAASMLDDSDRLQPVVVETRRGAEQLMRILESLARAELTDGLTLAQLIGETQNRLPRDASVIAIMPQVDEEKAIALANLRRSGYAVTAILNMYDEYDFAEASGPLLAAGIGTQQLKDEASVVSVCRKFVLR
ncbi:MAG: DUF58 domain-containing protein [Pirellulaceae bacterium]|jgi:uncharacterized protein (DUF58 family)|nr:DUF58 domain-containing protein [Pirellulaceae bacterium]MDP6554933.1 DUF58 domain-containing protein [Pirellulaceae bacterium]MDP6719911.1 DUF58 domain-containing protein [Pirellulaceae bacterium]